MKKKTTKAKVYSEKYVHELENKLLVEERSYGLMKALFDDANKDLSSYRQFHASLLQYAYKCLEGEFKFIPSEHLKLITKQLQNVRKFEW